MKKIFNAGTLILSGAIGLLVFIFILLIDFMNRDSALVSKDYYQQEIGFDAHRLAIRNYSSVDSLVLISYFQDRVVLTISPEVNKTLMSGYVEFYCPSDKNKDLKYPILLNESATYTFERPMTKVAYLLKLQLQDREKTYYKEISI